MAKWPVQLSQHEQTRVRFMFDGLSAAGKDHQAPGIGEVLTTGESNASSVLKNCGKSQMCRPTLSTRSRRKAGTTICQALLDKHAFVKLSSDLQTEHNSSSLSVAHHILLRLAHTNYAEPWSHRCSPLTRIFLYFKMLQQTCLLMPKHMPS